MKAKDACNPCLFAIIVGFLAATSVRADFSGPYSLTPVNGPFYGSWTAVIGPAGGWIDISNAPDQLKLAVPTGSFAASGLEFTTLAATNGTVSFNATSVSLMGGGYIAWFSQRSETNVTYQYLDQFMQGQPQAFAFPVQTGDTFGFTLMCGSDAIPPGAPPRILLMINNFAAPGIPFIIHYTGATVQSDGTFQFFFTNSPGAMFNVLASTNPALPLNNWTALGGLVETSPGQFQFTDPQATNYARRFYLLRAP
jgi:hypothetical protein